MSTLSDKESESPNPPQSLPERLALLEGVLSSPSERIGWESISSSAEDLHLLFRLLLAQKARMGTESGLLSPTEILRAAHRAAELGAVSWRTPFILREELERLAQALRSARLWAEDQPLWWEPLPKPTVAEDFWMDLTSDRVGWPERSIVQQACDPEDGRGWLQLDRLLPSEIVDTLHRELESAFASGDLTLEREGVGATGKISVRRSDLVLYTDGLDSNLLERAPKVAVWIQLALHAIGERLVDTLPGRFLAPPQNAMLARYPAPSSGYAPHMDNPGAERDNGRAFTLVVYLNGSGAACSGGELDLWEPGSKTTSPPSVTFSPRGGTAALFDARTVAHRVCELRPGAARWALTFWLNDQPIQPFKPKVPKVSVTEALLWVANPSLPEGRILLHTLDQTDQLAAGEIRSVPAGQKEEDLRFGLVCTVYRGGHQIQRFLDEHFALGFHHVVLVFDHLEEIGEQVCADRLRELYPRKLLTIWSGEELRRNRWGELSSAGRDPELLRHAFEGSRSHAVASRQTLNASLALEKARTDQFNGRPLDWLLHLDIDESFHLEGEARGGRSLVEHFQTLETLGIDLARYLNHELLPGESESRFKVNPRLAKARLGVAGWKRLIAHLEMGQDDPRPYFNGYLNGKSAVRVGVGLAAAGVHAWRVPSTSKSLTLAGPCILHHHFSSPQAFQEKYLAIAASPPAKDRPFPPSPTELAALALIDDLQGQGADPERIMQELEKLHRSRNHFTLPEIQWLEEAGLLLSLPASKR